ncbi:hypothetical protein N7507_010275 [Penicillium longicatenatum]|nr:hypothetical protein N7507_010275 [Penicillium longicatenatum]
MCDLPKTVHLMTTLLKHGADPYALFCQPIFSYKLFPVFPGDTGDPGYDDDESDLNAMRWSRLGIIEETLSEEYERLGLLGQRKYGSAGRFSDMVNCKARYSHKYGACSVMHSFLEDGAFIQPILEFLGNDLDLERRDPQSRTLFLAACRSKLGLDGAIDGAILSLYTTRILPNPYPQPRNPWQEFKQFTSTCTGPSLLEFFVSRGANLLAADKYGQNALHHMLAFIDRDNDGVPPLINTSLKYLVQHCPSLLNQPDRAGFYSLHYAIRRMCDHPYQNGPQGLFHFETAIYDLLNANADPFVRDSRGDTVLHYLAAGKLGEEDRGGDEQRHLLQVFLKRGFDPKARDTAGVTALEMFFLTKDEPKFGGEDHEYDQIYAIGQEVVDAFEQGGYILSETNAANQTLLHLVAKIDSERAPPWFNLLKDKGLDPEAKDKSGETPLDIAKCNYWIKKVIDG